MSSMSIQPRHDVGVAQARTSRHIQPYAADPGSTPRSKHSRKRHATPHSVIASHRRGTRIRLLRRRRAVVDSHTIEQHTLPPRCHARP
ncbi:hypothetical protein TNCT_402951 [Trichonephila clavata]|uniref:Uncharacterized protein n=1 Tax=Trichonephila clavata TaxID=2740835 RepID=A0A8X6H186_TRICU|nr:hypothetical protein TNCT_402951 [Trichonephila clavata]